MAPQSLGNAALLERERGVLMNTYKRLPVLVDRGQGALVYDTEGKEYIDLFAGVAVNTLGHAHPKWTRAIAEQASKVAHVSNLLYNEPMLALAERLVSLTGLERVFFSNSGAEVIEGAIKIARKWALQNKRPGREILTFERAFHGRTFGALTATGNPKYSDAFAPLVPGFRRIAVSDFHKVAEHISSETIAILVEPIQGEGGIWPLDNACLKGLRKLCDERGLLLILDEVQTGVARTGSWFMFQEAGILPDIVCLAKGLGGGFPIGAIVARDEAATAFEPGDHGSTYAGSALACAAALATLQAVEEENLIDNVRIVGEHFRAGLESLCKEFPEKLDHVRGRGLMLALEFHVPQARDVVTVGLKHGLLLNAVSDTTLRFVPPLVISQALITEALNRLSIALQDV